jgi:hypothetical protein
LDYKYSNDEYNDDTKKSIYDKKDDDYSQQSTYSRTRYPSQGSSSNNYRSRPRWSSPYENSYELNDRSRSRWSPSYENSYESNDRSQSGFGLK